VSHEGRVRELNEDRYLVDAGLGLWVVADGMGGYDAGEVASSGIVEQLKTIGVPTSASDQHARFVDRLTQANDELQTYAQQNGGIIGSTVAALLIYEGEYRCLWLGDSRVYLLRRGKVLKRTRDHSHVEFLLREGVITADQAISHPMRNFVECCLGGEPFLPEMTLGLREPLEANDILLACSDGLWGGLEDAEIGGAFPPARAPLRDELVRLAERSVNVVGSGADNTTAAAVRWIGNG
jgi:protein phosphatase